jgi:hypothetical protein
VNSIPFRKNIEDIEDDGYGLFKPSQDHLRWIQQFQNPPDPGTLTLVRHGNLHFL